MTRRIRVPWPDAAALDRNGHAGIIRLLAVSDDPDRALDHAHNRKALEPIHLVLGSGDLEPDYLGFLADAFRAPLLYIRGNHDRGIGWTEHAEHIPDALPDGVVQHAAGVGFVGFSWPSREDTGRPGESAAWSQVMRLGVRCLVRAPAPIIVLSHAPPRGAGDVAADPFHVGFEAYRWLADRLRPALWLHGHTPVAGIEDWRFNLGHTTCLNVTGSVLVELVAAAAEQPAAAAGSSRMSSRA